MERKSGLWIATTPSRPWMSQGRPGTTRRSEVGLRFDGHLDQSWDGIGGCFHEMGWVALSGLKLADRERVMQALFDEDTGCRLNTCRLPIGASDYALEWYSCNETDGDLGMRHFSVARDRQHLIPYIRLAHRYQPRLRLCASPWSPPTWMRHPRAYNTGTLLKRPEMLQAYALYLVRFVETYRREGIGIQQIHVQNELAADRKSPSCRWGGADVRDFIRNYLGPMLRKHRDPAELWLGTLDTDDYNGYALACLSDPLARQVIAGVSCQGAGRDLLARTHASWPALRLVQAANEGDDGLNSWASAHQTFALLQHTISSGVNAFIYGNLVLPLGGEGIWGDRQNSLVTVDPARHTYTLNPDFYVLKHIAGFVDRHAYRLGLTGEWAGNAVGFVNPDGTRVVVFHNPFSAARRVVLDEGRMLLTLNVAPESFNTVLLQPA